MKLAALFSFGALGIFSVRTVNAQDSVLTERVLDISLTAAELSALAYTNSSMWETGNGTYEHPNFEEIHFYTEEPDAAIVAKKNGRCFIAFRGTSATAADWEQSIDIRSDMAYKNNDNTTSDPCTVRRGYSDFLRTEAVAMANEVLTDCVATCADPEDCTVITGHSQGGASAAVASILTYDLLPTVVTFGMPPAATEGCMWIPSERFYRFVNHKKEDDEDDDVAFDPVPFSPTLFSHSVHYGHYLLVGPDDTAAKFLGIDQNYTFVPTFSDRQNEISAHTMNGTNYSYAYHIEALYNTGTTSGFPVSMDGFADGTVCESQYGELCASGSCQENACASKVSELCIKGSCELDSDCESGVCIWDACAAGEGQVEGGCPCGRNIHCKSGDCDTKLTSLDWVCEFGDVATGSTSSAGHAIMSLLSVVAVALVGALSVL